jgi:4-diphosphocytidyl-2-C-methyl-D-erythritol kinase
MHQEIAYAKINLSLEVLGRRADGYHDVLTVMQLISLHDTLFFEPADTLSLDCSYPSGDPYPALAGEDNLVWKAARLLQETTGLYNGAHITLHKQIPITAGLGGGSSDAAAALRGLARLWELNLRDDEMLYMASLLSSDVSFFFRGPTALGEGRGDVLTPISSMPAAWVVLVCPHYDISEKTRRLYASLNPGDRTDGKISRRLVADLSKGKFPSPLLLYNAFERPALEVFTGLGETVDRITSLSARPLHLSGSGPSLYTLYPEAQELPARKLYNALQAQGLPAYLATTVT